MNNDILSSVSNNLIMDVLREIGNIGAGNAATALAKMIDKKVDMNVPKVNLFKFSDVSELIGGEENLVTGILFTFDGDIEGMIMFLLDIPSSKTLINLLMPSFATGELDDFALSALSEIGNILSASYVNSLSGLANMKINISPPLLTVDMAGAILSVPAIQFSRHSDQILIIENEFIETQGQDNVTGYFLLVPELDSYEKLLSSLGVVI